MDQHHEKNFIEIANLHFKYAGKVIFKDASLIIQRNKITAIMGPSGSGKSTLLKLISAQLYPKKGKIIVDGVNIHKLRLAELYQARLSMGMLFQHGALFTGLNVFENVAFPLREHTHLPEEMITDLVMLQLETVGLRGAKHMIPSELSGGMARRVALARTLINNPKFIMYDEPFTGQDPITMGVLIRLIKKLNDILGLTSIIVSHDVAETLAIADYVYIISNNTIVGQGTSQQIMADDNPWVKQFIQGLADGAIPFHYPAPSLTEELGL